MERIKSDEYGIYVWRGTGIQSATKWLERSVGREYVSNVQVRMGIQSATKWLERSVSDDHGIYVL